LRVRELAPLRHSVEIVTPNGRHARWAADEHLPENAVSGMGWSSTMPGGHEAWNATLARLVGRDYPDLDELSRITVYAAGGEIVWQGRLQGSPRSWGDSSTISPQAVGYQAALEDDQSAAAIYVDRDLSRWGGASVQRQIDLIAANFAAHDPTVAPDATNGAPSLITEVSDAWAATGQPAAEAWYDAGSGLRIGSVYYAWKKSPNLTLPDPNWTWSVAASADDILTAPDSSGELRAAGPGTGTLTTTGGDKRFARAQLAYLAAAGTAGVAYAIYWTLAVYGDHGLTKYGTEDATHAKGLLASDIVAHAIGRWAPSLAYTTGPGGTIQPSSFVIPHLAFLEPTTAAEIVKQASRFSLPDWAVWEGPTFYWNDRGARGRKWRARVGPAQLQETGPSIDRLWNSCIVRYTDVDGSTRTVGPPGSRADTESAYLVDSDPQNPANQAGLTRRALLTMGTTVAAAAIEVGARFLEFQKVISHAGAAKLVGHVLDDRGVLWPVSRVRAGDSIVFTDAADPTSERRIVRANYSDSDKSCDVDLDAPPDAMDALLERLSVALIPLGVN
jgi:hypothetical protein